jgi:hypothetical protein
MSEGKHWFKVWYTSAAGNYLFCMRLAKDKEGAEAEFHSMADEGAKFDYVEDKHYDD